MTGQPTELTFDYEAIILALLVASAVHEGRWTLKLGFGQSAITQAAEGKKRAGVAVTLTELSIRKLQEGETVEAGWPVVDAALANPLESVKEPGVDAPGMN